MTVTLLQFVKAGLKRVGQIQGDAGELTTTTGTGNDFQDSQRQRPIDVMLQITNEAIFTIFDLGLFPQEASSATLILADGTREYDLPSDFEQFAGADWFQKAFRGTDGLVLREYAGGYAKMLVDQPVATDWTGDPLHYAVSPVDGRLRIDREPTSDQDGDIYNALYTKRLSFTVTMATVGLPFVDTVSDNLVPVVAEAHDRVFKKEFDPGIFRDAISRAAGRIRPQGRNARWGRRVGAR